MWTYYVQECTKVLSLLGITVGLRNVTVWHWGSILGGIRNTRITEQVPQTTLWACVPWTACVSVSVSIIETNAMDWREDYMWVWESWILWLGKKLLMQWTTIKTPSQITLAHAHPVGDRKHWHYCIYEVISKVNFCSSLCYIFLT